MKKLAVLLALMASINLSAQNIEDELGAWYMYFWDSKFTEAGTWGIQGDFQYRDFEILGNTEQLLLRSGLTYQPKNTPIMFTQGYAFIQSGSFGGSNFTNESRIYQEILIKQSIASRFKLAHRFRFEQRFFDESNTPFRTRVRYNIFVNYIFNDIRYQKGALYLAFYNELFMNTDQSVSSNLFDRNRLYLALGYAFSEQLRGQLGIMRQSNTAFGKNQLQLSLHHSF